MKNSIYIILLVLIACKPEKSPEPIKNVVTPILHINLSSNTYEVNQIIKPTLFSITSNDTNIITENINWTSSNSELAVFSNNEVQLLKEGTVKLYAQYENSRDSILINIISQSQIARNITLSSGNFETEINKTISIKVTVYDRYNNQLELENTEWISSNVEIATVDNGVINTKKFGEVEIYATSNGLTSQPIKISTYRNGTFKGTEGHSSSGDVRLIQRNGQLFVETQENFLVQSGAPDLRLFLSNIESGKINDSAMEISLAPKTNGKITFPLPISVSINDYNYILFHCKQYNTTFGSALLN